MHVVHSVVYWAMVGVAVYAGLRALVAEHWARSARVVGRPAVATAHRRAGAAFAAGGMFLAGLAYVYAQVTSG